MGQSFLFSDKTMSSFKNTLDSSSLILRYEDFKLKISLTVLGIEECSNWVWLIPFLIQGEIAIVGTLGPNLLNSKPY